MKQNKVWLITDTHFGHDAMVELCGRPKDHSERILKNLAEMLKPGDTLIHLGDFCIGNDKQWLERFWLSTPGVHRILVRGNHDRKTDHFYMENGFHFVCKGFFNKYFDKLMNNKDQIVAEDPAEIQKHFHKFIDEMPQQLKHFAEEDHMRQLMYASFLGGYRRGMSITLLRIDKALKNKLK